MISCRVSPMLEGCGVQFFAASMRGCVGEPPITAAGDALLMGQVELARGRIAAERAGEHLAMQLCLARDGSGLGVGIRAVGVGEAELPLLRGSELAEPAVRAGRGVGVTAALDLEQARGIGIEHRLSPTLKAYIGTRRRLSRGLYFRSPRRGRRASRSPKTRKLSILSSSRRGYSLIRLECRQQPMPSRPPMPVAAEDRKSVV